MLYENYELKMQRLANIKSNVLKLKIPIIILICLISISLVSLLSVKGMIVTDLDSVSDITYGESLSLQAEVLFGDADFEFRLVNSRGSDWSSEEPILPGTYEVRVVSSRTFGTSVGDSVEFTIFPKESDVKTKTNTVIFGDNFELSADLEQGDYFVYGDVLYENYYSLDSQKVTPIIDSLVVYNSDGVDVTTAYDFSAIETTITIAKRSVNFKAESVTQEYNGMVLSSNDYTISNLIEGHTFDFDINGSIVNFGSTSNIISNVSIFDNNIDVSHMYNITTTNGVLSVTKKDLYITTSGDTKIYDGEMLSNNNFTHSGLIDGDSVYFVSGVGRTLFGEEDNRLIVTTNSENYNIIYTYGKLTITSRDITVVTNTSSNIYDGFDYSDEELIITNVVVGDSYEVVSNTTIKFVGETVNNLVVAMFNGTTNISNCYNITYIYGVIKITKRDVTVTSLYAEKVYDGFILEQTNHNTSNLASTDITVVLTNTKITEVSEVSNILTVSIINGSTDVTSCYNINYVTNTLKITSREINVQTKDNEKEYDGVALSDSNWIYVNNSITLVSGHSLVIQTTGTITNVGTISNTYDSYTIYSNGSDITSNYIVNITEGELTITKRHVEILTASDSKVYDDTVLTNDSYSVTFGTFVLDHTLYIEITGSILTVGDVDNTYDEFRVLSGAEDVSNNYNLEITCGVLEIELRVIDIITYSAEKIYDGIELINHSWKYNNSLYEIISTHTDVVIYNGTQTDVGESYNTVLSFDIFKGSEDVSNNYTINIQTGVLTVTKRFVSVITDSAEKVYDGIELTKYSWTYLDDSYELVEGHDLVVIYTGSQLNVGESFNTFDSFSVMNGSTDVSNNYDITIELGKLTVTVLSVTVETNSNSFVYNGQVQYDEIYFVELAYNHTSKIDLITGELNVIENGINKYTIRIYDIDNNDVTDNYDIIYEYGDLEIYQREVTIVTDSANKVYDGQELTMNSWSYDNTKHEFVDGQELVINITGSITEVFDKYTVGSVDNTYDLNFYIDGSELSNYNLTINFGELIIHHRLILITTASDSHVFNDEDFTVDGYVYNDDTTNYLVDGQELNIFSNTSVRYVSDGFKDNTYHSDYTVMFGTTDVTKNYNFDISLGLINITTRTVEIVTASGSHIYDGEVFKKESWDYKDTNEYEVLSTHNFVVEYLSSLINVDSIENEIEYQIYRKSDGYDFTTTGDYNIVVTLGILEVVKRNVEIYSTTTEKIYDGTRLEDNSWYYETGSLEFIEEVVVTIESYIINYGTINNVISKVEVDGIENNNNYNITTRDGELSINKRDIIITTNNDSKEYDGEYLYYSEVIVESTNNERGIAQTDTWDITEFVKIKYVTKIDNEVLVKLYNDKFEYNEFDPNENYTIEYNYGKLEITPRSIDIKTGSTSEVYSGTFIFNDTYTILSGSLVSGDEIVVVSYTKLWLVSSGIVDNVFVIEIWNENGLTDLSYNYAISYSQKGTLEMKKFSINIISGSASREYDGNYLFNNLFVDENGEEIALLGVDSFNFSNWSKVKYYTENAIDNILEYTIVNEGINVTGNYEIHESYGTLTITKRVIVISTESMWFIYDGEDHYYKEYSIVEGSNWFISTDYVTITMDAFVTTVDDGLVANTLEWTLINLDALESYQVEFETIGDLWIDQLDLLITTYGATKFYDKYPLTCDQYDVDGLLEDHTISVTLDGVQIEVGESQNTIDTIRIYNSNGDDVTSSFKVGTALGILKVIECDISIITTKFEYEYSGEDITSGYITVRSNEEILFSSNEDNLSLYYEIKLTETETLYITIISYIDAHAINTSIENKFTFEILNDDYEDVSSNYNVFEFYGEISLVPRSIVVQSESKDFEFDSLTHSWAYASIIEGNIISSHEINFVEYASISKVGVEENTFIAIIFIGDYSNDYSYCYDIEYEYGTLLMSPGEIKVIIGSNTDTPFIFNGEEQSHLEFKIETELDVDFESLFDIEINEETITTMRNVFDSNINYFNIFIFSSGTDCTDLFDIEYVPGELKMIALDVVVGVEDNHVIYEYSGYNQTIINDDVIFNVNVHDDYVVTDFTYLLAPGTTSLTFLINFNEHESNYNIEYDISGAILEIVKRELVLTTNDSFNEFTGESQYSNDYSILSGSFAEGEEDLFKIGDTITYTDINYKDGQFIGNKEDFLIYFANMSIEGLDNIYNYYNLDVKSMGYLFITQIHISIESGSGSKIYDGEYLSNKSVEITGNLLDGHVIDVELNVSIIDVTQSAVDNEYESIRFYDKNNIYSSEELNQIYTIVKFTPGKLEIYARDLEIIVYAVNKAYTEDANYRIEHENYTGFVVPSTDGINKLVDGHYITTSAIEICEDRIGSIILSDVVIFDKNSKNVSLNYNVITEKREIKYTKVSLTVEANSVTKVYDGDVLFDWGYTISSGYLLEEHTLDILITSSITEVGKEINKILGYTIYKEVNGEKIELTEEEIEMYYSVTTVDGLLIVT